MEHQFGPNSTPPLTRAAQTTKPAPTPGARLSVAGSARASDVWSSFVSSNSTEFPRALLCHIGPTCRTADHAYHCPRDPTCHPGRAPTARADRTADLPVDIRSAPTDPPRPLKGARSRSSSPLFPRSHPSTASPSSSQPIEDCRGARNTVARHLRLDVGATLGKALGASTIDRGRVSKTHPRPGRPHNDGISRRSSTEPSFRLAP